MGVIGGAWMKILLLSDLHGNIAAMDAIKDEMAECDAVLFAGDFARFGDVSTGLPALEAMRAIRDDALCVIGNCDEASFKSEVEKCDMSCEATLVYRDGLVFAGSGGGGHFNGSTPNERDDADMMHDIDVLKDGGNMNATIIISHNPPKDTKCDAVTESVHVGSQLLRAFIEENQPLAVLTGHIHEGCAIDKIGGTVVINPGALLEGKYAVMTVEKTDGKWNVTGAELKQASGKAIKD